MMSIILMKSMNLKAEQFAQIVAKLDSQASPKPSDLRRAPRIVYQLPMEIRQINDGQNLGGSRVILRDLSSRGIGLLSPISMAVGAQFIVELDRVDEAPVTILCTVAHCRSAGEKQYSIGAEFTCVTEDAHEPAPAEQERIADSIFN